MEVTTKGRASHISFSKTYLLQILKDLDGPVLMETGAPTGLGRFTHSAAPNILVMSMEVRTGKQTDPESEEQEPKPEVEESQGTGENDKGNELSDN